ncbi:MAG: ribonuclease III [Gammaproteobacteria bacterium]|nr:MAG: ribonuclease III [Gammaproteobacteria bacterium]
MSSTSSNREQALKRLQNRLDYQFSDTSLLALALTHKSHSRQHNERLEFLGDAVLGYVVADALYNNQPDLAEDALTLIRAALVRKDTLAEVAQDIGLGEFLSLGSGERKSGGRQRASILADTLEAIIGAVSLDGGVEQARSLVLMLFAERLAEAGERGASKDPKTALQELLQGRALALPVYEVVGTLGSEHQRTFTVRCEVKDLALTTTGRGSSRRAAEKNAAAAMIAAMEQT